VYRCIHFFNLARDSTKHEAIIQLLEFRQEQDRRNLDREINEFRSQYQQPKNAREYDLNDSSIVYNSENNCLFFEGEDRNKQNREKKQKEQMNRWITEQVFPTIINKNRRNYLFSAVKKMKLSKNNRC
jgi:hypothetical protein